MTIFNTIPQAALLACAVALLASALLVRSQGWHGRYSLDSQHGPQKAHTHPTPRVGGIAIVVAVLASYPLAQPSYQAMLVPMLLAGSLAFVFGLMEDFTKQVGVPARLLATMASGVLAWAITGLSITDANTPGLDWLLGFAVFSVVFTAFAVGGVANAINIIDGFNGLAAGTLITILTSFALMAGALGDNDVQGVCIILGAAVLGFGLLNWPWGKLFLGDGGAYFMGFAVAWVAVLLLARHPELSAWAALMVCGYPVLEVMFSVWRRRRRGHNAGQPDRMHLHSLVKRRLVRRLLPHASNLVRNSTTGALMWLVALLPALIGLHWTSNTPALVVGAVVCAALYSSAYARLTQFRWCFGVARTLQPGTARVAKNASQP